MSRLFSRGNWNFGQRKSYEESRNHSRVEDESFDVGSQVPVYMSRQEAGEWMVPLDEEHGRPIEIMEDDVASNDDDDKFSDVSSSVVSTSTVAESRQFWLNCLKENGVDMNSSLLQHGSPKRPLSHFTKGFGSNASGKRSPDPLTVHNDNTMTTDSSSLVIRKDHEHRYSPEKQQLALPADTSVKNTDASLSVDEQSIDPIQSHCSETNTSNSNQPDDRTTEHSEIVYDTQGWSFTDGIPLEELMQHEYPAAEPKFDPYGEAVGGFSERLEQVPTDERIAKMDEIFETPSDPLSEPTTMATWRDKNAFSSEKSTIPFHGSPRLELPNTSPVASPKPAYISTWTREATDIRFPHAVGNSYLPKEATMPTDDIMDNTSLSGDDGMSSPFRKKLNVESKEMYSPDAPEDEKSSSYLPPSQPAIRVTTVTSDDTHDTSLAESEILPPSSTDESELPPGIEDILSSSLDHSLFVDDSVETENSRRRWIPNLATKQDQTINERKEASAVVKSPVACKPFSSESGPDTTKETTHFQSKEAIEPASEYFESQVANEMNHGERTYKLSWNSSVQPKIDQAGKVESQVAGKVDTSNVSGKEIHSPKVDGASTNSNDPHSWMYAVWRRKGLMKLPGSTGGPNNSNFQVLTSPRSESRTKARSSPTTPNARPSEIEPETVKTKNGKQVQSEPLVTPREAFVTLDYKAIQADEDEMPRRRCSLPVQIRGSAKKEGGRKSFESIMKMWRTKSNDHANGLFSPEQYMAQEVKERSENPPKSRPTQHSMLLSIAERTAGFGNKSNPRPAQRESKVTPRSASVGSGQKLAAGEVSTGKTKLTPNNTAPAASETDRSPLLSFSPVRDFTIEEQLQRPPKRMSSGKRRKSQPLPAKSSTETEQTINRRETINPKEHFRRRYVPVRSNSDYKSVIKNDYQSVVRTFLSCVEENKELEEPKENTKIDEITSNLSGIDSVPQELNTESNEDLGGAETITPRNLGPSHSMSHSAQKSASKDSPWTQQVIRQLEEMPIGSGEKKSSWREDRPWREDLVKRRVSGFSDCSVVSAAEEGPCKCSASVFSGNDELVEFFLPQMGMACNCGKRALGLRNPEEPTALGNILRPWQVQFLAAFGIYRGDQLVKAHHRSARALANALRQYRRKHGLTPFRTKSCGMALQIWSKTCKAYVRSIRKQLTNGTTDLKVPNTLYIISSFLEKMHEMHSPMPRNPNTVLEDEASV